MGAGSCLCGSVTKKYHAFVSAKVSWFSVDDDFPKFERF